MVLLATLDTVILSPKEFASTVRKGLANKRTTTFFIIQVIMVFVFAILYYLSVLFDRGFFNLKIDEDEMLEANFLEALHYSLITQTTVGYSGGYNFLSTSGKIVNFAHLFSMLAILLFI
tara:strand:- start:160 stop:516 length:357 start_codon:yes stop_codon:yes gene_type:complete